MFRSARVFLVGFLLAAVPFVGLPATAAPPILDLEQSTDGRIVVVPKFSTPTRYKTRYWRLATGGYQLEVIWVENGEPFFQDFTLSLGGGTTPDPTPRPPDPLPVDPDVLDGLAKLAFEWSDLVQDTPGALGMTKVECKALAANFVGLGDDLKAGRIATAQAFIAAAVEKNDATLLARRDAWLPWAQKLREHLNAEWKAGRLRTPAELEAASRAIAKGLRKKGGA